MSEFNGNLIGGGTPNNNKPTPLGTPATFDGSKIGNPVYQTPNSPEELTASFDDDRSRSAVDVSKYDKYIKTGVFDNEGLDKRRAEAQGKLEKLGGFLNQAIVGEIVGGAVQGLGSLYELTIGELTNKVNNEATDFNNWAVQLGTDIQNWSKEATPIYRRNPEKAWDMGDFGWWAENATSVASTLSLLIPAQAAVKGLGWLGKVAGVADKIGDTAKYWTKVGVTAGVMRNAENFRESLDVTNTTRARAMEYFGSMGDEARAEYLKTEDGKEFMRTGRKPTVENLSDWVAAKAGWTSYKVNSSNFAFDVLQTAAIFKGLSGRTRTGTANVGKVAEAQAKAAATKAMTKSDVFLQKAGAFGRAFGAQATEGLEEIVNYIGGEVGRTKGRQMTGSDEEQKSIAEMATDPHATAAGFWGILGGVAFQAVGNRLNKVNNDDAISKKLVEIEGREVMIRKANEQLAGIKADVAAGRMTQEQGKDLARKVVRDSGYRMGLAASDAGNVDLLLENLESEDFRDSLTANVEDLELSNLGFTKESVFQELSSAILQAEQSYNRYFNRIFTAPVSDSVKGRIAALQVETALTIEDRKKAIDEINRKIEPLYQDDVTSRLVTFPNYDNTRRQLALQESIATLKEALRSKRVSGGFAMRLAAQVTKLEQELSQTKEQIKLAREAAKAAESVTGVVYSEVADKLNPDLILLDADKIEQEAIIAMYEDQLNSLSTKETMTFLQQQENLEKKAKEAKELADYEAKIAASDESSITALISELEGKYGKRSKIVQSAQKQATRLKERRIAAEKQALAEQERADAKPVVVEPTAPIVATPAVEAVAPTPNPTSTSAPVIRPADAKALSEVQESIADIESFFGKTMKGEIYREAMLNEVQNTRSIIKQDKGYSDTHPVMVYLDEKIREYSKVEESALPVNAEKVETPTPTVEATTQPETSTTIVETETVIDSAVSSNIETQKADIEGKRQDELASIGDKKFLDSKSEVSRITYDVENASTNTNADGKLKVTVITYKDGSKREITTVEDGSKAPLSDAYDGSLSDEKIVQIASGGGNIVGTGVKENIVKSAQQNKIDKINAKYDAELAALTQQVKSITVPIEVQSSPDAFADTKEQLSALDDAFSDFAKALGGKGSGVAYSTIVPISPEILAAGIKFIKEAAKLGYVTFKDIAKLLYRKYNKAYEAMFPALKGVYMYLRSTDPAYKTDESADAIEAMTAESIAAEVKAEDEQAQAKQESGSEVWETANVFIPAMNVDTKGMTQVSEGVFKLANEENDKIFETLQELGQAFNEGDVFVEVEIDTDMTVKMKQSVEDVRNSAIAIKYKGVTIGYLNTMDGVEKAIEKGKANGWPYDFMQTLYTNRTATEVLRNRLFAATGRKLKQQVKVATNGTTIVGPNANPFKVVDNPIFAATPFEHGPGRHPIMREIGGDRVKVKGERGLGYDSGFIYMLVPSFRSDGTLAHHNPTIVRYNKLNDADAGEVVNVIGKITRRLAEVKGDIDIYQDEVLNDLRDQLDKMIAIRRNNVSPGGKVYAPIFNIYPPVRGADGSFKSYGRVEFLYDNNTKHATIYVNPWRNEQGYQIVLQQHKWENHKDTYESEDAKKASEGELILTGNGSKFLVLNPQTRDAFRRTLKDAFKTRYYFISRSKLAAGELSMKELADSGRIYVNVGQLQNSKGEKISNVFANPPRKRDNVKAIEEAQEENNLIISLDVNPTIEQSSSSLQAEPATVESQPLPETVPTTTIDLGLEGIENLDDPFALLTTETKDVPVFNVADREANWKRIFGDNIPLDINTHDLLFLKGKWAYGLFANAMGKVAANSPIGTEYHEAFHVVMHMYLTPKQLEKVLADGRAKYGNDLTDRQVEEKLAESFRTYMVLKDTNRNVDKTFSGNIKAFFEKLWNHLRRVFGKFSEQQLFGAISTGVFNYQPSADMVESAKKLTYYSEVADDVVTTAFPNDKYLKEYVAYMSKIVMRYIGQYGNMTNRELRTAVENFEMDVPRKYVLKALTDHHAALIAAEDTDAANEVAKIITFIRDEHYRDNTLWRRVIDNVNDKMNYNLEIDEAAFTGEIPDTKLTKAWDDRLAFGISSKESFDADLRRLLMTTDKVVSWLDGKPVIAANNPAKLKESVNFDTIYPALVAQMVNAGNVTEMMNRLKAMGAVDPTYELIYHKVNRDDATKAKWFANFNKSFVKERHYRLTPIEQGYNTTPDFSNTGYKLANHWAMMIQTRLAEKQNNPDEAYWNDDVVASINATLVDIHNILNSKEDDTSKLIKATFQLANAMEVMGINVDRVTLNKIAENPVLAEELQDDGTITKNTPLQVFRDKLLAPVEILKSALFVDDAKVSFSNWGTLNELATIVGYFQPDIVERSHFNVEGNMVYGVQRHNFLSRFFEKIDSVFNPFTVDKRGALNEILEVFREYAMDDSMRFSNALFGVRGVFKKYKPAAELTIADLNIPVLRSWNMYLFGGIKDTTKREGAGYANMSDRDWDLAVINMFFDNPSNNKNSFTVPTLVLSDSGNIYQIEGQRHRVELKDGKLQEASEVFDALMNTIQQEIVRMRQAAHLLFEHKDGRIVTDENGDYVLRQLSKEENDSLELNYHFAKQDGEGNPILMKDGKPTGNVFKFHNMSYMQDGKLRYLHDIVGFDTNGHLVFTGKEEDVVTPVRLTYSGVLNADKITAKDEVRAIRQFVLNFANAEIAAGVQKYNSYYATLKDSTRKKNYKVLGRYGNDITAFAADLMLNTYLAYVEHHNFFHGTISEFKGPKDDNKRAKEQSSPTQTFITTHRSPITRIAVLDDFSLDSSNYEAIVNGLSSAIKRSRPELSSYAIDMAKMRKANSTHNPLEAAVFDLSKAYLGIKSTDGQGYLTVDAYEKLLKDAGRWNKKWERIFTAIRNDEDLNKADLAQFLLIMKPYFFDRYFDKTLKKMRSRQLKMSVMPLLPQLIRGTQLEKINKWATDNKVDHIYFASASKVGTGRTTPIADNTGNLLEDRLANIAVEEIPTEGWGLQLDVVPHLKDAENKLGIQIARIIFGNLSNDAIYELPGVNGKLTGPQLLQKFHEVMGENIEEDSRKLMARLGAKEVDGQWVTEDLEKVYDILAEEIDSHELPQNYKDMIEPYEIDGKTVFRIPLFLTSVTKKYQTLLTSLFTNNVINQKFPGGHVVLATDAFITGKVDLNTTGIDFTSDKKAEIEEKGEFQLNYHLEEGTGVTVSEVLMPAHTKKLFTNGDRLSIDQIPEELRTFIGYRIPTEAKYSMFRFKIVGFLPEVMDSTLVMPKEFVAQTGWDFDVDSVYFMSKTFNVNRSKDDEGNTITDFEVPAYEESSNNNRAARNNRIFDIFSSILSNSFHYGEMVTPGTIKDIAALRQKQEQLTGSDSNNINPNSRIGQDYFRSTNIAGRTLKGLAANQNSLAPILQAVKWEFSTPMEVAYSLDKISEKSLRDRYGDNVVIDKERNIAIVSHSKIAKAPDGSYLNADGNVITDHAAQILANILDIVKDGVPYNLNTETFDAMAAMVYSGIPIDYAGQFIRQPIIKRLAEEIMDSEGLTGKASFTTLSRVKRQYQTNLFKVRYYLGKHTAQEGVQYRLLSKNGNWQSGRLIFIENGKEQEVLGYTPDENNVWSVEELDDMIAFTNPNTYPGKGLDKRSESELKALEKFLAEQLKVLNMYQTVISPNGKALSKASKDFAADKFNIGLLSNIDNFEKSIETMGIEIYAQRSNVSSTNDAVQLDLFSNTSNFGAEFVYPNKPEFNSLPGRSATPTMIYAGVGSRQTPSHILKLMEEVANELEQLGYTLRSGGADGADLAFEAGVQSRKEIFLKDVKVGSKELAVAREIHPNPLAMDNSFNPAATWNTMARNTNQIFGKNLDTPVDFVLAWTPDNLTDYRKRSRQSGGTGQAIDMASRKGIPVINMANPNWKAQLDAVLQGKQLAEKQRDDTQYGVLNSYYQWGIRAADSVLSPLFFNRREDYKTIVNDALKLLRMPNNPDNVNMMSDFLNYAIISNAPFFSRYDRQRVLGVGATPKFDEMPIEDFIDLSTANKVQYVKTYMRDLLGDGPHILDFLAPELNQTQTDRIGFHRLEFSKPKTSDNIDNEVIQSFADMYFSDNAYLNDLATDLVAYDAFTTGMTFGRNSYSNYIPADVLDSDTDVQLGDYLRYIEENGLPMENGLVTQSIARTFAKSMWNNTAVVPRVRSRYVRDSEGRYVKKLDDAGNDARNYTVDNTPDWNNEAATNAPVRVLKSEFKNEPYEVQNARFILVSRMNDGKFETVLLERVFTEFDNVRDESKSAFIYYIPTAKLGNTHIKYEMSEKSVLEENNVPYSREEYLDMVITSFPVAVERSAEGRLIAKDQINCK